MHTLKKWNCNTVHLLKKKGHIYFAQVIWNFPVICSRILLPSSFVVRIEMNALNVPLKVWSEMEITAEWIRLSIAWKRRWLIATCVIECYRTVTLSCYWFCWFPNSTHTCLWYFDELNKIYYYILKNYHRNFTLAPINARCIQRNTYTSDILTAIAICRRNLQMWIYFIVYYRVSI